MAAFTVARPVVPAREFATGSQLRGFHNCCETLGLPGRPFSLDMYSQMLALIHWRSLRPLSRGLVVEYWRSRQAEPGRGGLMAALFPRTVMTRLDELRCRAYGVALDDWSVSHCSEVVCYPWALTDSEFAHAYHFVFARELPEIEEPVAFAQAAGAAAADGVVDRLEEAVVGLLERHCGKLVGAAVGRLKGNLAGGFVAGVAVDVLVDALKDRDVSRLRVAYEVDRVRRGRRA